MRDTLLAAPVLSRRRLLGGLCAAGLVMSGLSLFVTVAQASAIQAERYVDAAGDDLIAAAKVGSAASFLALLKKHVDMNTFALFALGRFRDQLSSARTSEYVGLVSSFMANTMAAYASKFVGTGFDVTRSRPASSGFIIETKMEFLGGRAPEKVNWKVVENGSSYKVTDIYFKQVWLATLLRDKFTAEIQNGGGIEALFSYLQSAVNRGRGAEF